MGVDVGHRIGDEVRLVADVVVCVGEEVRADLRGDDFAAFVVREGRGDGVGRRRWHRRYVRRRAGEDVVRVRVRVEDVAVERSRTAVQEVAAERIARGDSADHRVVRSGDRIAIAPCGKVRA